MSISFSTDFFFLRTKNRFNLRSKKQIVLNENIFLKNVVNEEILEIKIRTVGRGDGGHPVGVTRHVGVVLQEARTFHDEILSTNYEK